MAQDRWRDDDDDNNRWDDDRRYGQQRPMQGAGYRGQGEQQGYRGGRDSGQSGRSGGDNNDNRGPYRGGDNGYGQNRDRDSSNYGSRGRSSDDRGERGMFDRASDEVSSWFGDDDAERRRQMDKARSGHSGRGPKGYTRTDDRIEEDVNDRLTDDWRVDASEIEVSVSEGEVTLDGTVSSREEKRAAEDLIEEVSGVKHVQNNLRVQRDTSSSLMSGSTGSMPTSSANTSGANSGSTTTSRKDRS